MKRHAIEGLALLLLSLSLAFSAFAVPPPTLSGFTYQGYLKDNNVPANGTYDFRFRLFTLLTGGVQVGGDVLADDVAVSDGRFTVTLGFAASLFDGSDRYLVIGVRPGASTGAYTNLSPRQKINATPYALHADSANTLGGLYAYQFVETAGDTMSGPLTIAAAAQPTAMTATATSTGVSGQVSSSDTDAAGVRGTATAGTGSPAGVEGKAGWLGGTGVRGLAATATTANRSVISGYWKAGGEFYGPNGVVAIGGVPGFPSHEFGNGVVGVTVGSSGYGVIGATQTTTGTCVGVYGRSSSNAGYAGLFSESSLSGATYGVASNVYSPDGVAGYFYNQIATGTAIQAAGSGIIRSAANTEIVFSPFALVPAGATTAVNINHYIGGDTGITATGTGNQTIYLPLQLPAILYGNHLKIKSVQVTYITSNASSYITSTIVRLVIVPNGYVEPISDATDRTSTSWQTYTLTDAAPNTIEGCAYLKFTLYFSTVGHVINIRTIKLVLVGD